MTCLHVAKTVSNIKIKLTPKQLYMFKETTVGHFLDIKLVFNRSPCHYILLREVEDDQNDAI